LTPHGRVEKLWKIEWMHHLDIDEKSALASQKQVRLLPEKGSRSQMINAARHLLKRDAAESIGQKDGPGMQW